MKTARYFFTALALFTCMAACNNSSKDKPEEKNTIRDKDGIKLQLITTGMATPFEINISPDDTHRLFITDNIGKIWILKNDSLLPKPFFDISSKLLPDSTQSVLGTISGVAFHPQFATNRRFYVCYTAATTIPNNPGKLVISAFTASQTDADAADLTSEQRVFELEGSNIFANGAQISFGPDGYLYISIGDDAIGDSTYTYHAQDLNYLNGKLLRIDVNKTPYGIPADNPFIGMKDARPEIWAYGFRKIWRFTFDAKSKLLFGADAGEQKNEEIDIIEKGANYGWPVREGDSSFQKEDGLHHTIYTPPINTYARNDGICIIGGAFYYGKNIPFLKGKYVFADFNGSMFTLTKNPNGLWIREPLKILNKGEGSFLICGCSPDENNELYVMGILDTKTGSSGAVYKVVKG